MAPSVLEPETDGLDRQKDQGRGQNEQQKCHEHRGEVRAVRPRRLMIQRSGVATISPLTAPVMLARRIGMNAFISYISTEPGRSFRRSPGSHLPLKSNAS